MFYFPSAIISPKTFKLKGPRRSVVTYNPSKKWIASVQRTLQHKLVRVRHCFKDFEVKRMFKWNYNVSRYYRATFRSRVNLVIRPEQHYNTPIMLCFPLFVKVGPASRSGPSQWWDISSTDSLRVRQQIKKINRHHTLLQ